MDARNAAYPSSGPGGNFLRAAGRGRAGADWSPPLQLTNGEAGPMMMTVGVTLQPERGDPVCHSPYCISLAVAAETPLRSPAKNMSPRPVAAYRRQAEEAIPMRQCTGSASHQSSPCPGPVRRLIVIAVTSRRGLRILIRGLVEGCSAIRAPRAGLPSWSLLPPGLSPATVPQAVGRPIIRPKFHGADSITPPVAPSRSTRAYRGCRNHSR